MADFEHKGQLTKIDENGDKHILYPETEIDCVHGLNDALGGKAPSGHTEDKNNPHNVTAEQVGARPNTWTPTADDVGARPNNWLPTIAEIGAASNEYLSGLAFTKKDIPANSSKRYAFNSHLFVFGRVNSGGASANCAYVIAAYNEYRAPIVTELAKGSGLTFTTGGDNTNGWYVEIANSISNGNALLTFIGGGIPMSK